MGMGLTDVRLSNHTVLLSLPGSTPNTITDRSSHQCFLPSGIPCDQRGASELPRRQLSYAAYSAVGSLQVLRHFSDQPPGCGSFLIFPSIYLFSFFSCSGCLFHWEVNRKGHSLSLRFWLEMFLFCWTCSRSLKYLDALLVCQHDLVPFLVVR